MKITFGGSSDLAEFWSMVKMLLTAVNPWIMISFSIVCVGFLLTIIVKLWRDGSKETNHDSDYDYKEI